MDGSGNVTAVNTFGATGLVSRHTSTGSTFYTFDSQGSTVERLDSNQNVLSTSVFDAFGKLLSGSASDPWGYEAQDGYFTDTETGLISLSFRCYDPAQGRFLNRDPIEFDGGINLYGYVGNGPTTYRDRLGLRRSVPEWIAGVWNDWDKEIKTGGGIFMGTLVTLTMYPSIHQAITNVQTSSAIDDMYRSWQGRGGNTDGSVWMGSSIGWVTMPDFIRHQKSGCAIEGTVPLIRQSIG